MELFFVNGTIQKYRITVLKPGELSIVDNGSKDKYTYLPDYYTRVEGPDFNSYRYGRVKGTSVRGREGSSTHSKIIGVIQDNENVMIVSKSKNVFEIGGEKHYWLQVVSDF